MHPGTYRSACWFHYTCLIRVHLSLNSHSGSPWPYSYHWLQRPLIISSLLSSSPPPVILYYTPIQLQWVPSPPVRYHPKPPPSSHTPNYTHSHPSQLMST